MSSSAAPQWRSLLINTCSVFLEKSDICDMLSRLLFNILEKDQWETGSMAVSEYTDDGKKMRDEIFKGAVN